METHELERTSTMKLMIDEFENFALEQGYENGLALFKELGYDEEDYEEYAEGKPIDIALLKKMCLEIGTSDIIGFIAFNRSYEWEHYIDLFQRIHFDEKEEIGE